jgi:hypothetical protein
MGPPGHHQRLDRLPPLSGGSHSPAIAIRFPGVSYGGAGSSQPLSPRYNHTVDDEEETIEDPDLLSGVIDAPPRLAIEMADLIRFKTSTLTTLGFQRNGVWGEETAAQKIEHLGLMFGALAASPNSAVRGYGVRTLKTSLTTAVASSLSVGHDWGNGPETGHKRRKALLSTG